MAIYELNQNTFYPPGNLSGTTNAPVTGGPEKGSSKADHSGQPTAPSTASPTEHNTSGQEKRRKEADDNSVTIALSVLGGVLAVVLIGIFVFLVIRRRRNRYRIKDKIIFRYIK